MCHYHGRKKSLPRRTCTVPSPEQAPLSPKPVLFSHLEHINVCVLAVLHGELKEEITHKGTSVIKKNSCLPKGNKIGQKD